MKFLTLLKTAGILCLAAFVLALILFGAAMLFGGAQTLGDLTASELDRHGAKAAVVVGTIFILTATGFGTYGMVRVYAPTKK